MRAKEYLINEAKFAALARPPAEKRAWGDEK